MAKTRISIIVLLCCIAACNLRDENYYGVFSISFNFTESAMGWTGDFADYPKNDSVFYELLFKHDTLPANLNPNGNRKALILSGKNHSDDLFMFIKMLGGVERTADAMASLRDRVRKEGLGDVHLNAVALSVPVSRRDSAFFRVLSHCAAR